MSNQDKHNLKYLNLVYGTHIGLNRGINIAKSSCRNCFSEIMLPKHHEAFIITNVPYNMSLQHHFAILCWIETEMV